MATKRVTTRSTAVVVGHHSEFAAAKVETASTTENTVSELRPLQDENFKWPNQDTIVAAQKQYLVGMPENGVLVNGVVRVEGKVWVPKRARELIQRLCIVAHCGVEGHRGGNVMLEELQRHFSLGESRSMVNRSVNACLLCKHVKGGTLIQRRWPVSRVVTRRNECLHMDFMYLGESYGVAKYVLVLKDELTHYCEPIPADSASSLTAAEAVLDWYKRFGMPGMWMSDNGSHFKNQLMEELSQRFRVNHEFVPVYTPWINGTVERVNRDILQVLRVMLLELQYDTRNWFYLLPMIQANLNHSPAASLGNCAPIELFTGLPAASRLNAVVCPEDKIPREIPLLSEDVQGAVETLRASLHAMHTVVVDKREKNRLAAIARSKGGECNFEVGDFVLWSRVDKRFRGNKLLACWIGPFRVVEALFHSFVIEHLLTGAKYDVHGSRLKYYREGDLNVSAELREHVAIQGIVLEVRAIVDHRLNRSSNEWELCVAWRGLQDAENSWEPLESIFRDVPALVAKYVEERDAVELQQFI
ncbi:hypothetical protein FI667_g16581, partial [Globisporangium splendens]